MLCDSGRDNQLKSPPMIVILGWFTMEHPMNMNDLGVPHFRKPSNQKSQRIDGIAWFWKFAITSKLMSPTDLEDFMYTCELHVV